MTVEKLFQNFMVRVALPGGDGFDLGQIVLIIAPLQPNLAASSRKFVRRSIAPRYDRPRRPLPLLEGK
jgi:hypothetical protein